jgi:hypothetical protein
MHLELMVDTARVANSPVGRPSARAFHQDDWPTNISLIGLPRPIN